MHSPSCTGPQRRGEEAVVTANVKSGEGKTLPSHPLPQQHLFQLFLASLATTACQTACPIVPVVSKLHEKAISLLHKNSEWWACRGGAEGGFALLIGAGLGFFFSITEKIKQSAVQQRLLRLYPSFPPHQLTRRGPLFQASANTAPSGGRLPGQGPWRKFYCARG